MKRLFLFIALLIGVASQGQFIIDSYRFGGATGPFCVDVVYNTATNLQESPAKHWRYVTGTHSYGKTDQVLESGKDGQYYAEISGSFTSIGSSLNWSTSNAVSDPYYVNAQYGIGIGGDGNYFVREDGEEVEIEIFEAFPGDLFGLRRIGNTIYASLYVDNSWFNIYTFSTTTTATLYCYMYNFYISEPNYIINPQLCTE